MKPNPQVNCDSYNCFYNKEGLCKRGGIHASKKSCCCYVNKEEVETYRYEE